MEDPNLAEEQGLHSRSVRCQTYVRVMSHCFLEPVSDQEQRTRSHSYPTRLLLPLPQLSQRPNLVQRHTLDSDSGGDEHEHNRHLRSFPPPRRDRAPHQPDRHHRHREYGTLHGGQEGLRHRHLKAQWVVDGKVKNQRFGSGK